jgi:hypothetical protein
MNDSGKMAGLKGGKKKKKILMCHPQLVRLYPPLNPRDITFHCTVTEHSRHRAAKTS